MSYRYFFDSAGLCKSIITENPTGNVVPASNAGASSYLDGDVGRDVGNSLNISGVLRNKAAVTLASRTSTTYGGIKVNVSSSYYPTKLLIGTTEVTATVGGDQVFTGFTAEVAYTVTSSPNWGSSNSVSCACCQCYVCDGGTCFVSGEVLMEDMSTKDIRDLQVGDRVIGLSGINTVMSPYLTKLGNKRSILRFMDTPDDLIWSGEHMLWTQIGGMDEYFGTCDYNQYVREKGSTAYGFEYNGLTKREPHIITNGIRIAHVDGWKNKDFFIDRNFGDDTELYSAIVDGDHTFIVNGYVVGGFVDDTDFDYKGVKWKGLDCANNNV